MPQMAPLNWLILYPYFILLLYLVMLQIYFIPQTKNTNYSTNPKNKLFSIWKW